MLDVYICDDHPILCEYTAKEISTIISENDQELKLHCVSTDPNEVLQVRKESSKVGLYFLDVDLGEGRMNGVELAQEIRKMDPRGFIVFVSSAITIQLQGISANIGIMAYIEKGDPNETSALFRSCITRAVERLAELTQAEKAHTLFFLDTCAKHIAEPYDSILYFEEQKDHRICMYTINGLVEFTGKLSELMGQLDERFYRCHRTLLVNLDKICGFHLKSRVLDIQNHSRLNVSFLAKGNLRKKIEERNQAYLLFYKS